MRKSVFDLILVAVLAIYIVAMVGLIGKTLEAKSRFEHEVARASR